MGQQRLQIAALVKEGLYSLVNNHRHSVPTTSEANKRLSHMPYDDLISSSRHGSDSKGGFPHHLYFTDMETEAQRGEGSS